MADPFRSAKRRLTRARSQIDQFELLTKEFMESAPFSIFTEDGYQGIERWQTVKLKQLRPFPDECGDVAAEAIDGLRSALDQACFAVAEISGKKNAKSAYFPFADDALQLENTIKRRCRDLPADFVNLLRTYQPYSAGNDLLWAFNKARQGNQHKILIDTTISANDTKLRGMLKGDFVIGMGGPGWDDDKSEMTLAQGWGFENDLDPKVTVSISFKDAGPLSGRGAVPLLRQFLGAVTAIIEDIERYASSYPRT